MKTIEIILPAMGEGITDATITRWLVSVGDIVEADQSIAEIATDKVDSEIPSSEKGKVKQLLFNEGDVPQVGQTIAIVEVDGESTDSPTAEHTQKVDHIIAEIPGVSAPLSPIAESEQHSEDEFTYVSPLVRKIATEEGITPQELKAIPGTGLNNRVTKDDILQYINNKNKTPQGKGLAPKEPTQVLPQQTTPKAAPVVTPTHTQLGVGVEVVQMDRMRKLIAEHMISSKQTSAHVTSFIEVDMTKMVSWRNRIKDEFQKTEGEKLTLTPLFVDAAVKAIKQHPMLNSSVDGDKILIKKSINIGIAAALPNGNLIVPVIKNADKQNLSGLASSVNDLAKRARANKLQPDEIQGGTFTITNLGMFDTLSGTPIINQPQVAILAIGAIVKRPVVIESPEGDTIGIRQMAILSLSYDHRVVDGALGGMFLKTLKGILEGWNG
ncbi:MAG: 2-oxo acid dehydrogenase subunit E2 [Bacteroidales bacterium]|nr:2-oxo acid dehydrogenase subunit E2 [Bacteroidales bacterium]MBN2750010.1 2-oxo acid dehydrogenase subunit E2 [Bacteroidales bacterium]